MYVRLYIYISLYVSPCLCVQMTVGWELIGIFPTLVDHFQEPVLFQIRIFLNTDPNRDGHPHNKKHDPVQSAASGASGQFRLMQRDVRFSKVGTVPRSKVMQIELERYD